VSEDRGGEAPPVPQVKEEAPDLNSGEPNERNLADAAPIVALLKIRDEWRRMANATPKEIK
jgi:hypothetical protein